MKKKWFVELLMCLSVTCVLLLLPMTTLAADVGDFSVTGGTLGIEYTYAGNTLTFTQNGVYEVSMKSGVTTTTADKIAVAVGITANITLNSVHIDVSAINTACAFDMTGATVNLTLTGVNTLISGDSKAGLQCPEGATLTIGGIGTLNVTSGDFGAGIGGGDNQNGGMVTIIGGTINATGLTEGAGIGGGADGDGGTVIIDGGAVAARSGLFGAGIGGGMNGPGEFDYTHGGFVTINGGIVTAISGNLGYGAGIGGGGTGFEHGGNGAIVTISGGVVTAAGSAGIGGGNGNDAGNGGTLAISGGTVTANGSDIGIGSITAISGGSVKSSHAILSPTNGTDPVYLTTVKLTSASGTPRASAAVTSLGVSLNSAAYPYGIKDMRTDADGNLYLYLPQSAVTTAAQTASKTYSGSVVTTTDTATSMGTLKAAASPKADRTYTVTYDPNGGAGTVPKDRNRYDKGEKVIPLSGEGLARVGYTFEGWALEDGQVVSDVYTMDNGDVTFFAVWVAVADIPDPPKTGGAATSAGFVLLGLAAIIGLYFVINRKRRNIRS